MSRRKNRQGPPVPDATLLAAVSTLQSAPVMRSRRARSCEDPVAREGRRQAKLLALQAQVHHRDCLSRLPLLVLNHMCLHLLGARDVYNLERCGGFLRRVVRVLRVYERRVCAFLHLAANTMPPVVAQAPCVQSRRWAYVAFTLCDSAVPPAYLRTGPPPRPTVLQHAVGQAVDVDQLARMKAEAVVGGSPATGGEPRTPLHTLPELGPIEAHERSSVPAWRMVRGSRQSKVTVSAWFLAAGLPRVAHVPRMLTLVLSATTVPPWLLGAPNHVRATADEHATPGVNPGDDMAAEHPHDPHNAHHDDEEGHQQAAYDEDTCAADGHDWVDVSPASHRCPKCSQSEHVRCVMCSHCYSCWRWKKASALLHTTEPHRVWMRHTTGRAPASAGATCIEPADHVLFVPEDTLREDALFWLQLARDENTLQVGSGTEKGFVNGKADLPMWRWVHVTHTYPNGPTNVQGSRYAVHGPSRARRQYACAVDGRLLVREAWAWPRELSAAEVEALAMSPPKDPPEAHMRAWEEAFEGELVTQKGARNQCTCSICLANDPGVVYTCAECAKDAFTICENCRRDMETVGPQHPGRRKMYTELHSHPPSLTFYARYRPFQKANQVQPLYLFDGDQEMEATLQAIHTEEMRARRRNRTKARKRARKAAERAADQNQ